MTSFPHINQWKFLKLSQLPLEECWFHINHCDSFKGIVMAERGVNLIFN